MHLSCRLLFRILCAIKIVRSGRNKDALPIDQRRGTLGGESRSHIKQSFRSIRFMWYVHFYTARFFVDPLYYHYTIIIMILTWIYVDFSWENVILYKRKAVYL